MFSPEQLDVPMAEVRWHCTLLFGAASAASIVGISDPGGSVATNGTGLWTLTFPESQSVFLDSIHLIDNSSPYTDLHMNSLAPGTASIHNVETGTVNSADPAVGGQAFITLILRNP